MNVPGLVSRGPRAIAFDHHAIDKSVLIAHIEDVRRQHDEAAIIACTNAKLMPDGMLHHLCGPILW